MTTKTIWHGLLFVLSGCTLALAALEASAAEPKSLSDVVAERAFPEYAEWWPIGPEFLSFMSEAIVSEWAALPGNDGSLDDVKAFVSEYLTTVYGRETRPNLVEDFVHGRFSRPPQSGEFDALSYAFFRSAYELMARGIDLDNLYSGDLESERRLLTKRVGEKFFSRLHDHLGLTLPPAIDDESSFSTLKAAIDDVGKFLLDQGYYRDHVAFRFDVATEHQGRTIDQPESAFLDTLEEEGVAHALFEMGYPVILPSAVYLFHSLGEAQHHSSRTMEGLFDRVGVGARETHDFDPIGYPSDMVVELWEISKKP